MTDNPTTTSAMQQAADIARQKGVEFEALYPRLAQGCELAAQAICERAPAADVIEGMREALDDAIRECEYETARWSDNLGEPARRCAERIEKLKAALALPDSKADEGGA